MSKLKTEDLLMELAEQSIADLNLEIVDVEYTKEGGSWYVRLFIDKPEGINHDDCKEVSKKMSALLDAKDPIPTAYILEVSSPGIDRPLKKPADFEKYKGYKVRASLYFPLNGTKEIIGFLQGLSESNIVIKVQTEEIMLPLESVSKIRLEADFD